LENNEISIDYLKEIKRIDESDPKYEATVIYNGNKIDCWIYTGATIKIRLINPKVLSVYDYTCSLPEKLYLDIKTKSHVMNHYEEKIKKGLLDIIKGNGHI